MHSSFSICYLSLSSSPSRTHTQMLVMQSGGMLVSCSGWFLCRTCPVGSWLAGLLRLTQIHTLILNGYTNTHTHRQLHTSTQIWKRHTETQGNAQGYLHRVKETNMGTYCSPTQTVGLTETDNTGLLVNFDCVSSLLQLHQTQSVIFPPIGNSTWQNSFILSYLICWLYCVNKRSSTAVNQTLKK